MDLIPWRNKSRTRAGDTSMAQAQPLALFRNELDNLFDRFMRDPLSGWFSATGVSFPKVDLTECEDDVCVTAELPGVKPEDVNIELAGNTLRLSGEKSEEKEERHGEYRYAERQFGSFSRIIQLPTAVDPNQVDANYKDGVLTIRLVKHAESKPKRIEVRAKE